MCGWSIRGLNFRPRLRGGGFVYLEVRRRPRVRGCRAEIRDARHLSVLEWRSQRAQCAHRLERLRRDGKALYYLPKRASQCATRSELRRVPWRTMRRNSHRIGCAGDTVRRDRAINRRHSRSASSVSVLHISERGMHSHTMSEARAAPGLQATTEQIFLDDPPPKLAYTNQQATRARPSRAVPSG